MSRLIPDTVALQRLLDLLSDKQCAALFDALEGRGVEFSPAIGNPRDGIKLAASAGNEVLTALVYGIFLGQRLEAGRHNSMMQDLPDARPVKGTQLRVMDGGRDGL